MKFLSHSRRTVLHTAAAGALTLTGLGRASAQANAAKPMKLVVGFGAGTALDTLSRELARQLTEVSRASVVVDNRPGAGAMLAVAQVGNAPPDGTTLLVASVGEATFSQHLYRKPAFDANRLVPISQVVSGDVTLVVGAQTPVNNVDEFLRWSRDKSPLLIGTFGPGTPHHLVSAMFAESTGRKVEPVHYRAPGDALNGLVMGELHASFVSSALAKAWQQGGRVKVMAVSTSHRSPLFPEVQTMREANLPGAEFAGWVGIFAPPGTSPELADQLNADIVKAARMPAMKTAMENIGFVATGTSRKEFESIVGTDRARYGKLIESLGLKLD